MELALGKVKTVADCDDLAEDGVYFPQFNGARNLRDLVKDYVPAYERYLAAGGENTPALAAAYENAMEMTRRTVNDYDADNEIIYAFYDQLVAVGALEPAKAPSGFEKFFGNALEKNNSLVARIFGSKGFLDFTK